MAPTSELKPRVLHALNEVQKEQIKSALALLCQSSAFSGSRRSRDFLSFVVKHALLEPGEHLKERTIGVEVFNRPPSYSTGDDPIVRVQAGDVRRRLERFYRLPHADTVRVQIGLPVGSYMPEFLFDHSMVEEESTPRHVPLPPLVSDVVTSADQAAPPEENHSFEKVSILRQNTSTTVKWAVAGLLLLVPVIYLSVVKRVWLNKSSQAARFWEPVLKSEEAVLIGVPKSVAYAPGPLLYNEYRQKHPGSFQNEWQRTSTPLPLDPDLKMTWSDMQLRDEFGVGVGTTYAAAELSVFFARRQKASNLRVGNDYAFEDIRKAPTVLLGAFNNRWTMQFSTDLPYRFVERDGRLNIEERDGKQRVWQVQRKRSGTADDYALVVRLPESASGQFLILAAGIGTSGSQAAVDFICNDKYLEDALKNLDPSWPNRNVAFVLKTAVTDHVAGPPVVVVSTIW